MGLTLAEIYKKIKYEHRRCLIILTIVVMTKGIIMKEKEILQFHETGGRVVILFPKSNRIFKECSDEERKKIILERIQENDRENAILKKLR
jgi:hypothetical protein